MFISRLSRVDSLHLLVIREGGTQHERTKMVYIARITTACVKISALSNRSPSRVATDFIPTWNKYICIRKVCRILLGTVGMYILTR